MVTRLLRGNWRWHKFLKKPVQPNGFLSAVVESAILGLRGQARDGKLFLALPGYRPTSERKTYAPIDRRVSGQEPQSASVNLEIVRGAPAL